MKKSLGNATRMAHPVHFVERFFFPTYTVHNIKRRRLPLTRTKKTQKRKNKMMGKKRKRRSDTFSWIPLNSIMLRLSTLRTKLYEASRPFTKTDTKLVTSNETFQWEEGNKIREVR